MSAALPVAATAPEDWRLPDRGVVGMWCLIIAESAIFTIFVVAYIYYLGKNLFGPEPRAGFWLATIVLALVFMGGTAREWYHLIYEKGFTIRTNLFGTTYYSLVGLHAFHVIVGIACLVTVLVLALQGKVHREHAHRTHVLGLYWHFVDVVWVIVFSVVYVVGR
jgi:cytochrome c oxidase subunit 3